MNIVVAFIREPAVLVVALLFLAGIGLPILDAFSKAITDANGKRGTIVRRCLAGEAPLWVVYWLFGIIGGVLAGLFSLFAASASPVLGIVLMASYGVFWAISLWQCARNAAFEFLTYVTRGLLVLVVLAGAVFLSGMVILEPSTRSWLLSTMIAFVAIQFTIVYFTAFLTGFGASGIMSHGSNHRHSLNMLRSKLRNRMSDHNSREHPRHRQQREKDETRLWEELGDIADIPGDGRGFRR